MNMYVDVRKRGHLFCLIFNTWASRTRSRQAAMMELRVTETAGIGVFSLVEIEAKTKLCFYSGDVVNIRTEDSIESDYVMKAGDRYAGLGIDARNPTSGFCGFFNDNLIEYRINALAIERETPFAINQCIEIVAKKKIRPNTEICISYGGLCFWKDKYLKRNLEEPEDRFTFQMFKHHCEKENQILLEID